MAIVALDGTIVAANPALAGLDGGSAEALTGMALNDRVGVDDRPILATNVARAAGGDRVRWESSWLTRDGARVPALLTLAPVIDDLGTPARFLLQVEDLTERRRAEAALAEAANRDPLTGIANRRGFEEALRRAWDLSRRDDVSAHVLVADMDGLKAVNDRLGHAAGDQALQALAAALSVSVRATDTVARIGGDEFAAVLVASTPDEDGPERLVERVRADLRGRTAGWDPAVDVSAGHAGLAGAESPEAAVAAADQAMYRAKRSRR
jgi:diguanylate cyclase (GGDEF)-like protein/PAS domain S-box-containing protein